MIGRTPRALIVLARLTTGLCAALLLTAAAFDAHTARVTSGTVPAEAEEGTHGRLAGATASVVVVGHNAGDDLVSAADAVAFGVGAVEIDVREIDGELAASHDQPLPFLGRVAFRGPSLSRAWEIASLRPVVLLHLKDHSDRFVAEVARFLAERPPRRLIIQASSLATLASVQRRIPQAERLLLVFNGAQLAGLRLDPRLGDVVDGLSLRESLVTPPVQEWARRGGLQMFAWTVNDLPRLQELLRAGVDGVMTDNLDLARSMAGDAA
jgi:glycerophosphoryl diester phosphodiesterase